MTHTNAKWERVGLRVVAYGRGDIAGCPTPQNGGVFECHGNAGLIAAAPDLLEALRGLLPYAEMVIHSTDNSHDRDKFTAALAALKKAQEY
jgi:hypothetical protein